MTRRSILFAVKLAFSVCLLWFLSRGIDFNTVGRQIAAADPLWLAIALILSAATLPLSAYRWQLVTRAIREPVAYRDALSITVIGWFFNQTLPSTIGGDAVRIYLAWRTGISKTGAVHGIIIDRLVGLFVVIVMAALFFMPLAAGLNTGFQKWFLGTLISAGFGGYIMLFAGACTPTKWLENFRIGRLFRALSRDANVAVLSVSPGSIILVMSLILLIVFISSVHAIALALGLELSFSSTLVALPAVFLVSSLPISLAGWGVREQSMVLALGAMGVADVDALAISVLLGLIWIVIGLPGALVWLDYRRRGHGPAESIKVGPETTD